MRGMNLQIGDQFDHYQIRGHMAQGGMSNVYRVQDLLTGKEAVLKIPDRMLLGDPAQHERFQRELAVMRELNHPAIQHGIESGTFNRTPYLVTELIEGRSLRDLLDERQTLPVDEAVTLIKKIIDGVAYCHKNEVVHRDLKPENILVTNAGQPVILDFGLALTKGGRRVTYANLTATAGTPDYMAPEQIEGQRGDERTDEYAIGIMLFEMLTGAPPFHGDSPMTVMAQHLNSAIPRLDKLKPGIVSPALAAVVMRSLRRDPNERYPDLPAMLHDLEHLEGVDTEILAKAEAEPVKLPFYQTQGFKTALISVLVILGIVVLAVLLQAARVKP
jgi:serine/threonine-protein kinase